MRSSVRLWMPVLVWFAVAPMMWSDTETARPEQPIRVLVAVRDTQGRPVSDARIEVWLGSTSEEDRNAAIPFTGQTGAAGDAIIMLPHSGPARIRAMASPQYLSTVVRPGQLDDGSEVSVEVERGGTLKGKVQDAQGRPYRDVPLRVLKRGDDDVGPSKLIEARPPVTTDPDGSFAVEKLSSGFYIVMVYCEDPREPQTVEMDQPGPPVHVTEDGVAETTVLVRPLGTVNGTVDLPRGDVPAVVLVTPIPADAAALNDAYVRQRQLSVPTNGATRVPFALRGLTSGGYRVEIEAEGFAPLLSKEKVFLPVGGSVSLPTEVMEHGVQVDGLLRLRDGDRPVADTDVYVLFPGLDVPITKSRSDEDGTLHFGRLAPGSYVVRASLDGLLPLDETVEVRKGASKASFDLRLRPGAVLEGTLVDDGRPKAGVEIVLTAADEEHNPGRYSRMHTDGEGRFRFRGMPSGVYALLAPGLGIQQELALGEDEKQTLVVDVRKASPLQQMFRF